MWGKLAAVVLVIGVSAGEVHADSPPSPIALNQSLFHKPVRIKFVQRSSNVDEWQIEYKRDNEGNSLILVVQRARTDNVQLNSVPDAQMLFPIFFEEAVTTDADQAQASVGKSAAGHLWGGEISYAPARELEERPPVFGAADQDGNPITRAPRGPDWNECVMFVWHDEGPPVFVTGRYCHRSPAGSTIMSPAQSLAELKKLNLDFDR